MQVTPYVYRHHIDEDVESFGAMHPGGSNIYFVGDPADRMSIVDTGEHYRDWTIGILDYYRKLSAPPTLCILITHGHGDHIGGLDRIQEATGAPVRCHPKLAARLTKMLGPRVVQPVADGETISLGGGASVVALFTPGHEDDHVCYWMASDGVMFTGDTVLGSSTGTVRNLGDYMRSLDLLAGYNPARVLPAHGDLVDDGASRIRSYIAHRKEREQQILAALKKGITDVYQIVDDIYPRDLRRNLREAAARNVRTHLAKLVEEGRVAEKAPAYMLKS
ncbi:MAG: MBL fold metallo-hydrolase [Chloroflexi bacterium]|nr:MBL fold metallo-hydrolase [Chloroflexota bacterium]